MTPLYVKRASDPARAWSRRKRAVWLAVVSGRPAGVPLSRTVPRNTTSGRLGTEQPVGTGTNHVRPDAAVPPAGAGAPAAYVGVETGAGATVVPGSGTCCAPTRPAGRTRTPRLPRPSSTSAAWRARCVVEGSTASGYAPATAAPRHSARGRSPSLRLGVGAHLQLHPVRVAEE